MVRGNANVDRKKKGGGKIKSRFLRCKESDIAYGIFVFPCQLQMMDEYAGKHVEI